MSFDLAVWEGPRPADDASAGSIFEELYRTYYEDEWQTQPTRLIAAYTDALLSRWPDLVDMDLADDSPFAAGPIANSASGPILYFPLAYSRADEVSAATAELAASLGLVCFDPEVRRLRPFVE